MNVGGVGVHPEVVAVGVAIKMEPQPVTTNLDNDNDGEDDDDDDVKGYASHIQCWGRGVTSHLDP